MNLQKSINKTIEGVATINQDIEYQREEKIKAEKLQKEKEEAEEEVKKQQEVEDRKARQDLQAKREKEHDKDREQKQELFKKQEDLKDRHEAIKEAKLKAKMQNDPVLAQYVNKELWRIDLQSRRNDINKGIQASQVAQSEREAAFAFRDKLLKRYQALKGNTING